MYFLIIVTNMPDCFKLQNKHINYCHVDHYRASDPLSLSDAHFLLAKQCAHKTIRN